MRVSGFWSLAGAAIVAFIIADLLAHVSVTNSLIHAGTTESRLAAGK